MKINIYKCFTIDKIVNMSENIDIYYCTNLKYLIANIYRDTNIYKAVEILIQKKIRLPIDIKTKILIHKLIENKKYSLYSNIS